MNGYKKIIKSQKLRFQILKFLSFIPDKWMLSAQYYIKTGTKLNWKNPQRYSEKIQVYKVKYRDNILGTCVDKYKVRSYVESKGLGSILNTIYGIYNSTDEIIFDDLPTSYVIKSTDGSGGQNIIICKDKERLDIKSVKIQVESWLNKKDINAGREWAYTQMGKSSIIIEQLLLNPNNPSESIRDYKFYCFDGIPKFITYHFGRFENHCKLYYDLTWNRLDVYDVNKDIVDMDVPKPENFERMIEIAKILSEDFPHVRVDLYNLDGEIFFGELTFYPMSGFVQYIPDSFDLEVGKLFSL